MQTYRLSVKHKSVPLWRDKKNTEIIIPEEFKKKLDKITALKTAFDALTPERHRAYILYFSAPKQSFVSQGVGNYMQKILKEKELIDWYIQ